MPAENMRQQLMAKADAEIGKLTFQHGLADHFDLPCQPWQLIRLPDLHRPAKHPEPVNTAQINVTDHVRGYAGDEVVTVLLKQRSECAGMLFV